MAVLSMFYGIIVSMYYFDNKEHHIPHIHVRYQGEEMTISIADGRILQGSIPNNKMHLVLAWMEIHREELIADWELASTGTNIFTIDPLK